MSSVDDSQIILDLPNWVIEESEKLPAQIESVQERMAAVIRFSQINFERKTGGPFAAGVFERDSGRLVAMGVNRVMPTNCSSAHAEVMALSIAQKRLNSWDLGAEQLPQHQLVVNWRPCIMCLGAVIWSGVRSLVVAGDGPELEQITGFDEGPVTSDWRSELEKRGITTEVGVLTADAITVFKAFAESGNTVYNARQGG